MTDYRDDRGSGLVLLNGRELPPATTQFEIMPVYTYTQAKARRDQMIGFVKDIMKEGVDYGLVPGTDKPTLFKPGAEKLASFFGLSNRFVLVEKVEDWAGEFHGGEPLFHYWYKAQMWRGDMQVAEAEGSCNSHESKYRWRWVAENDVPASMDKSALARRGGMVSEFEFAIDKAETGGQYGKPQEYWDRFRQAIDLGTARRVKKQARSGRSMDAWEIDCALYRVPNEDVSNLVNTIQKMAQKRAFVAVVLIAVNASEFFTQDVEDMELADDAWRSAPKTVSPVIAPEQDAEPIETPAPRPLEFSEPVAKQIKEAPAKPYVARQEVEKSGEAADIVSETYAVAEDIWGPAWKEPFAKWLYDKHRMRELRAPEKVLQAILTGLTGYRAEQKKAVESEPGIEDSVDDDPFESKGGLAERRG